VTVANQYGIRPDFIYIACYPSGGGTTPPPWDQDNCTNTDAPPCNIALGQSTVLWQYHGNYAVIDNGVTKHVHFDEGNPNLDFHTALGQYTPIPPA
jgi:hypothetical protein